MRISDATTKLPPEERDSLADQVRRSSWAVCANVAEAWRKCAYPSHFARRLDDAESEAEEAPVRLERCGYLQQAVVGQLDDAYDRSITHLVLMRTRHARWSTSP